MSSRMVGLSPLMGLSGLLRILHHPEGHAHGIEDEQTPDERLAHAGDELDDLRGLQAAHHPGEHAEHATLRTRRHHCPEAGGSG